jgi:hypothetical protein
MFCMHISNHIQMYNVRMYLSVIAPSLIYGGELTAINGGQQVKQHPREHVIER